MVRVRSEAGTLAWLLASAGEMTTNPLLLMIAWPGGLSTKLMNFAPSAASGAVLGMVRPVDDGLGGQRAERAGVEGDLGVGGGHRGDGQVDLGGQREVLQVFFQRVGPVDGQVVDLAGLQRGQQRGLGPGFCAWREGLVLRPELADRISGIQDVADNGLRLVNREPGAEARSLLDRKLADAGLEDGQLPGYDTHADGHLQVAAATAAGLADAGIASEPAALAYDLVFIPLAAERFDLVIPAGQVSSREVQGLLKVLTSAWLLDQLASLPGYDPGRCGEPIATLPPRH